MAVFRYSAVHKGSEDHDESGTIVAQDKIQAFDKLTRLGYTRVGLQKVEGMAALLQRMTADIR